ncbi:MAG: DNA-damage-inducible protein D family protein, partial [uncultured bacterium]
MTPQLSLISLININQSLDEIKRVEQDLEYWSARDLMPLLGYTTWRMFNKALDRAKESCKKSDQSVKNHFVGADKTVQTGSGAMRNVEDFLLTRYACYLVAQNGDPRKVEIAQAQTYFATQTRRQELREQRASEDKRLDARLKLKDTEGRIESTVYERGIKAQVEFAVFKDKHIRALYGGISTKELKKKRNIPSKRALADFDSTVELKAKDFALAMTDHNIKDKNLRGSYKLNEEVIKNSRATRHTLLSRGIRPESLK